MGTNCASLVADLFLFCYERDFMMSLSGDKQADIIDALNTKSRYLNDIGNIYNIDGWLRMGLLPPPREFCRHILSCRELKTESFKRCLHSVLRGVSL